MKAIFSSLPPLVAVIAASGITVFLLILVFRPSRSETVVDRFPFLLGLVSLFIFFSVGELPFLFPGVFGTLLGHSIYQHDPVLNGTWIEDYWTKYLIILWTVSILFAMPWSIVNLFRRRAVKFNVLALMSCVLWVFVFILALTGHFLWYL
jgi:hypothetical protein